MKRQSLLISFICALCFGLVAPCAGAKVVNYSLEVVKMYPHDVTSYTQGLFWHNGRLIETTGQFGESTLREVDLETGETLVRRDFSSKYFAEGACVLGDNLYVLTWTNKVMFIYDPETLEHRKTYSYPREGWGLTTDGEHLIASDGSHRLYFMDKDMRVKYALNVTFNGRDLRNLNELEWIDGRIWANIYETDSIVIINPSNGEVEGLVDCSELFKMELRAPEADVLNGIAVSDDGRIFVTGKYWPSLFEVRLK